MASSELWIALASATLPFVKILGEGDLSVRLRLGFSLWRFFPFSLM